ncbi:MAG: dephospho-CoA kinase [Candidatus Methylumidiphilus sp.]
MLKIGLTGGVGCGKSTVAGLFAGKGVPVFDADQIARELVEPGQVAFAAIVAEFGEDILEHGRINRAKLRDRVFANPLERQTLEAIIHPLVYQALVDRVECLDGPYCIFAIPLLVETGRLDFVDRILVVDCHPDQQYERVRQRDGLDEAAIGRIIQAQAKRGERLAVANDVIENTGLIKQLRVQVEKLHEAYLTLAPRISLRSVDAAID